MNGDAGLEATIDAFASTWRRRWIPDPAGPEQVLGGQEEVRGEYRQGRPHCGKSAVKPTRRRFCRMHA